MASIKNDIFMDGNELILREGKAADVKQPEKLVIENGSIHAPLQTFKHLQTSDGLPYPSATAFLTWDEKNGVLNLKFNIHDPVAPEVTGKLQENAYKKEFGINTSKAYSVQSLISFLKKNKFFFPDKEEFLDTITALQEFRSETKALVKAHNDQKGNIDYVFKKESLQEKPIVFKLCLPLFNGFKPSFFKVEVVVDQTDANVSLNLISDELFELEISMKQDIIAEVEKGFEEEDVKMIYVN